MSFSDELIESIRQVRSLTKPLDLTRRDVLLANLAFVFHVIKGSENLLHVAASMSQGTDLHRYFLDHLLEEQQHEKWLSADLLTAGIDVERTVIPRQAVELVGSQYYFLFHVDPAALLGYMAVLECFPTSLSVIEALEAIHGEKLLRTLRYHATHDPDHGSDLRKVIDDLPADRHWIVMQSALQSARYFGDAMASLCK